MNDLLDKLNDEQKEAVIHDSGPLLIVAGAGTGKTTVLINRLLYLIQVKNIPADKVLLVTFTEKASQELNERADKLLPYGYVDLWITNFHGLADRLLRQEGLHIGLPTDYQILTRTEQWIFVKKNLAEFDLDYYRPLGNPDKFISELIKHFSRLKDENITAEEYLNYAEGLKQDSDAMLSGAPVTDDEKGLDAGGKLDKARVWELAQAFHTYNRLLLANKFLDFDDLIVYALRLLTERPEILERYQAQFPYIMVDEFQDTNLAQYELIKKLAGSQANLVAVGDDNQSIFKFRGASLSNIMHFKEDYPTAKEIVLNKNYRSGQVILDRAYDLIKHNDPNTLEAKLGINKKIIAAHDQASTADFLWFPDVLSEAAGVVELIKARYNEETLPWSEMAILVRANATADRFIAELKRQGVPYQFVSLRGLYFKPIILDLLAYLRLLDNYHESSALLRVLNFPQWRLEHEDLVNVLHFAHGKLWSLYEALNQAPAISKLSAGGRDNIARLLASVKEHGRLAKDKSLSVLLAQIIRDLWLGRLEVDRDQEDFSYLNQFYAKVLHFEAGNQAAPLTELMTLLDWELAAGETGALAPLYEDVDTVKVMTVHTAKGLEFKQLFVVDVVERHFPTSARSEVIPVPEALVKEILPVGETHLEEERRLFYVAMTRAKDSLCLTGSAEAGGVRARKPSRFVAEAGLSPTMVAGGREHSPLDTAWQVPASKPETGQFWRLPDKFSFSQLNTFSRCPLMYLQLHLMKLPVPPKGAMTFGRIIHNVLHDWLSLCLSGGQSDLFTTQTAGPDLKWPALTASYEHYWTDYGFADRTEADKYKALGLSMLKTFFTDIETNGAPTVLWLEKKLYPKLAGYSLDCAVDRIDRLPDGSLEIIDYKTGESKSSLQADDKRQLFLYQLAVESLGLGKVSQLTFYYLKNGSKLSFTAKPADLEKTSLWVKNTIEAIMQHDFTATPSSHVCQYCDLRQTCQFRAL